MNFDSSKDVISKHKPLFDRIAGKNDQDTFVLSGGRASYKSYTLATMAVMLLLVYAGKEQQANVVVFMQKKEEIRDGIFKQFESVIDDLDIAELFDFRVSPFEVRFKPTESVIKFYGLNKQDGKKANAIDNIAMIWFEEFDQFDSQASIEPTLDTFMRHSIEGENVIVAYSFNPPRSAHHWVFSYIKTLKALKIHTTYLDDDTGKNLLPKQLIDRIEYTKEVDEAWYNWNYLGIVPKDGETDFPSLIPSTSELELDDKDYLFLGIDSATRGKDSTKACILSYNTETLEIKFLGFETFDDVWEDGYTSQKVGSDIANFARSINANAVYVDPMQGQHIIDYLVLNAPEITTRSVNFGSRVSEGARGKARMAKNKRAEMYINASDQLKSKRVVAYADSEELERQLNATEFEITAKEIYVIKKEVIRQRIGKSPDEADSFVLAIQAIYDTFNL